MTDSDLRELDGWIAEHFMGFEPTHKGISKPSHIRLNPFETLWGNKFYPYSSDPAAFALVKREIERRGWGWACYSYPNMTPRVIFEIMSDHWLEPDRGRADTEELAGCLAVKAAVEGSNAHSD